MKTFTRAGAVALAAVLALSPASAAFATGDPDTETASFLKVKAKHPYVMLGDAAKIKAEYEIESEVDDETSETTTLPSTVVFTIDFGDGSPVGEMTIDETDEMAVDEFEVEAKAAHTYAAVGEYTVSVTATPDVGAAETAKVVVNVTTDPVPYPYDGERACPKGSIPRGKFKDVGDNSAHRSAVDCLAEHGLLAGNGRGGFAPGRKLTREQLATILVRTIEQAGGTLSAGDDAFGDDDGSVHEDNIDKLAAAGLVGGTSADTFEPGAPVTRGQMSSLLVRIYKYLSDQEVEALLDYFTDDGGDAHEENINLAAAAGFTNGRSKGVFSPGGKVTREQIATFLMRMLDRLVVEDGVAL